MDVNNPKSWFVVGASKEITQKPISYTLKGKKFVLYRTEAGEVAALSAICPHMGVDLSIGGKVKDGCIRCPLHGWNFNKEGECIEIPVDQTIPEHAKLTSYPVVERHGYVFLFNHTEVLYPLPFFEGEDPQDFLNSEVTDIHQEGTWYAPALNVFDIMHFAFSHGRFSTSPSDFDLSHPYCAKVKHHFYFVPKYFLEKVIKKLLGNRLEIDASIWGGNAIILKSDIGPFRSRMVGFCTPLIKDQSVTRMFVYRPKRSNFLMNFFEKILIRIQANFIQKYFQNESDEFKGLMVREKYLHPENDKILLSYLNWWKKGLEG